jgi:hypothetical protein
MVTGGRAGRSARVRNALVAGTSGFVVLSSAVYVAAPTKLALAVETSSDHAFNPRGASEVLYGRATDLRGGGVFGVRIDVTASHDDGNRPRVVLVSGPDGTFRQQVHLNPGVYTLSVSDAIGRHHDLERVEKNIRLQRGQTYRIDVEIRRHGVFAFLPVSSY